VTSDVVATVLQIGVSWSVLVLQVVQLCTRGVGVEVFVLVFVGVSVL